MKRNRYIVALIFAIFFVISFLTNILGPLVPDIISDFHVSYAMAAVLPFCFFIAYGVMSIPAGFLVERWGDRNLIVISFVAGTAGGLRFALHPTYEGAAPSLFIIAAGRAAPPGAIHPTFAAAAGWVPFALQF